MLDGTSIGISGNGTCWFFPAGALDPDLFPMLRSGGGGLSIELPSGGGSPQGGGHAGGGGGAAVPGFLAIDDNFNSDQIDTSVWTSFEMDPAKIDLDVTEGELQITRTDSSSGVYYAGLHSNRFDFSTAGSYFQGQLKQRWAASTNPAAVEVQFHLILEPSSNVLNWTIHGGSSSSTGIRSFLTSGGEFWCRFRNIGCL